MQSACGAGDGANRKYAAENGGDASEVSASISAQSCKCLKVLIEHFHDT